MAKYFAVIKLSSKNLPQKMTFNAEGVSEAIKEMTKLAGVSSTINIAEFDLMEVLGNDTYRPAAIKNPREVKMRARVYPDVEVLISPVVPTGETTYAPYSTEVI